MERYARDDDVGLEEQGPLDQQRTVVVEEMMPPFRRYKFRQDHREKVVGTLGVNLLQVLQERLHERAIR